MTLQELQNQALQLPLSDRLRLVQSLLTSIQQEMPGSDSLILSTNAASGLDPWTQSLMGVIQLHTEQLTESYVDYLEEKYS